MGGFYKSARSSACRSLLSAAICHGHCVEKCLSTCDMILDIHGQELANLGNCCIRGRTSLAKCRGIGCQVTEAARVDFPLFDCSLHAVLREGQVRASSTVTCVC